MNVNGIQVEVNSEKQLAVMADETRAIIKFCVGVKMTPIESLKCMHNGKSEVSRILVFKWNLRFTDSLEDNHHK